jgi:hypothetical protein
MIDEDDLRALLIEAADSAPPPGDLPEDLLTALAAEGDVADVPSPRFRVQPRVLLAAAAAVVLLIGVAAVFAGDDGKPQTTASGVALDKDAGVDASGTTGGAETGEAPVATTIPGFDASSAPVPPSGEGGAAFAPRLGTPDMATDLPSSADADTSTAAAAVPATDSALVVKTGSLTLEVRRGAYDKTLDLMTTKAIGIGGYVAQSSTSRNDDRPSGALVLRVPAAQFDGFLADVRKLGDVVSEDTQGTDVTGQHADLQARRDALQATRDKLGTVLAQAKTVEEILTVQDRITGVQTQIEQLDGQLSTIDDQVKMASLTVSLGEPGAAKVELNTTDERTLGGSFSEARHRFGNGIEALIAWSGDAAVVLLVGVVLLALGRLAWPRLRRYLI